MIERFVRRLMSRRRPETEHYPFTDARASAALERLRRPGAGMGLEGDRPEDAALPDSGARRQALRRAFTPSRPQRGVKHFVGRGPELARILRAIEDERAHVVLYGERGRGKTSLVNLVAEAGRGDGFMVARYACSAESSFDDIVRGLARHLPSSLLAAPVSGAEELEGCEGALPPGRLEPRDVVLLPSRLTAPHMVLMVDEFDRVADEVTRTRLADTIKQVSDRGVPLSFVIIGVSENLDQLLGRHPSIQRNIVGIQLPLMSDAEVLELLDRGARESGLYFRVPVRGYIAAFARGVPYIAQLLALRAAQAALQRDASEVAEADLEAAVATVISEAEPHVLGIYERLTEGGRDRAMEALLRAVAAGPQDRFGRFPVESPGAAGHTVRIAGTQASAALWKRLVEAGALRPCGAAELGLHCFAEPILPHYVLLRAAAAHGIEASQGAWTGRSLGGAGWSASGGVRFTSVEPGGSA